MRRAHGSDGFLRAFAANEVEALSTISEFTHIHKHRGNPGFALALFVGPGVCMSSCCDAHRKSNPSRVRTGLQGEMTKSNPNALQQPAGHEQFHAL